MATVGLSSIRIRANEEPNKLYGHATTSSSSPPSSSSSSSSSSLSSSATRAVSVRPKGRVFLQSSFCNNNFVHRAVPLASRALLLHPMTISASSAVLTQASNIIKTEELQVGVGGRKYPIYIGSRILDHTELFKRHIKGKDVLLITNPKVSPLYTDQVAACIEEIGGGINVEGIVLSEGDGSKSKDDVFRVIDRAAEAKMDRTATFVGLGGGVINDLCGFAAAVYEGGVNYIQIPTTLTAQVDVAVADETGIYHLLDKQSICSYYEPECVIVDANTLKTLPGKELISGIAELIKFALVRDGAFLPWLKENMEQLLARDPATAAYAIKRACEIKAEILSLDKQQGGLRDILSLGRKFGHGIEKSIEPGEWIPGEALAVGIVMTLDLSHRLGWIDDSVLIDAVVAMERAHLPTAPPAHISKETLKKNMDLPTSGHPRLALPKGPAGNCVFTDEYDEKAFESMMTFFCLGNRV